MTTFRDRLNDLLREQAWAYNGIIDRLKLRFAIELRVKELQLSREL